MKKFGNDRFFVSGKTVAAHNFHKLHRKVAHGFYTDKETLEKLHTLRNSQLKAGVGQLTIVLLIFFAVSNDLNANSFDFEVPYLSVSLSKDILVLSASLFWCIGLLSFNSVALSDAYFSVVARRVGKRHGWHLISRYFSADGNFVDSTLAGGAFFKSSRLQTLHSGTLVWLFIPMFLGLGAVVIWEFCRYSIYEILETGLLARAGILGIISIMLLIAPVLHCALTNVPFPVRYDRGYVRWVFLYDIHRRSKNKDLHPQAQRWLGASDIDND